jgi:hypothetical protein
MIMWVPPNPKLDRDFVLKTMVWGTPHFKKPHMGAKKKVNLSKSNTAGPEILRFDRKRIH